MKKTMKKTMKKRDDDEEEILRSVEVPAGMQAVVIKGTLAMILMGVQHYLPSTSTSCGEFLDPTGKNKYANSSQNVLMLMKDFPDIGMPPVKLFGYICAMLAKMAVVEAEYSDLGLSLKSPVGRRDPIFVCGLPKSGTTLLQTLLALDPASRTPRVYEVQNDLSDYRNQTLGDRYKAAKRILQDRDHRKYPKKEMLRREEDRYILDFALNYAPLLGHGGVTEELHDWSRRADLFDMQVAFQKKFIQILDTRPSLVEENQPFADYWIFKDPDYISKIPSILKSYPNARIIWAHNSLKNTVLGQTQTIFERKRKETVSGPVVFTVGEPEAQKKNMVLVANATEEGMKIRDTYPLEYQQNHFLDIQFDDLLADPIGTIEKIHFTFELGPLSAEYRSRLVKWLKANFRKPTKYQIDPRFAFQLQGCSTEEEFYAIYKNYLKRFPNNR
jgi:hypothetical protein